MGDTKHKPTANGPHGDLHALKEDYKQTYLWNAIDNFLDEFVFHGDEKVTDGIWSYGVNLIKCFLILADFKDAVSTGNGDHLLILRKQLLIHFFSTPGFNEFAIEMLTISSNAKCCYRKQRPNAANGLQRLIGKAVPVKI